MATATRATTKKVLTEDLGKMFEMAICLYYETPYDGTFKYSLEEAQSLKNKLSNLKNVFPYAIRHCASRGSKYDFECLDNPTIHLSAKTTKKDGKVCPQVIGQPSRKKFCEFFGLDLSVSLDQIKTFISNNITNLLQVYSAHTFDCPILYYNKHSDLLAFIVLKQEINWSANSINFSHNIKNNLWNESSSISINGVTIGEFQVHNNRDCIKFRWCFEKLLALFRDHFTIIRL
jgi:hypothetical protein